MPMRQRIISHVRKLVDLFQERILFGNKILVKQLGVVMTVTCCKFL